MVDVMVDVMVMVTGTGTGSGNGRNNNNNNNNNRRRRSNTGYMRQEVIESVLESFKDQPSNLTMIQEYERMAKTHLNNYLEALLEKKAKKLPEDQDDSIINLTNDMIGPRKYSI